MQAITDEILLINQLGNGVPLLPAVTCSFGEIVAETLDLYWELAADKGITLHLDQDDDGPGIPQDKQGKIFEKFYRGEQSRTSIQGTGLGFYTVTMLVAATGGKLQLVSAPRRGSCFTITWPQPILPERTRSQSDD